MSWIRIIIVVALMAAAHGMVVFTGRTEDILPVRSFNDFPDRIGSWQGKRGALDDEIFNVLGVEDYVLSDFTRPPGRIVNLYIGFYQSQRKGDLIHSPRNCMPGAGWNIVETGREILTDPETGQPYKVASLVLKRGDQQQMVLYWFHSRGRIIASEYMQKIWLVTDAIFRNRTDGSFVRLITPVKTSRQEAISLLKEFADHLTPLLDEYIPS
ncbi:MAG: EpsI family protein [Desulfobacteraceae bacterium]|nr:EpsI family protein [Desulfobacteraceae bacterium]